MKRLLLLAFLLLGFSLPARGQGGFTTVTAQVLDPTGLIYQNCSGSASFVPSPTATQVPTLGGSTFQTDVPISGCDSFGRFTIVLADNLQVQDGHTGAQGSQWQLNICSNTTPRVCFPATLTITGTTLDISAALQAVAAPLPVTGSGGGLIFIGPSQGFTCSTTTNFTSNVSTAFACTLTTNVTTSFFTTGGKPGTIFQVDLLEGSPGGFTFNFPANVNLPLNFVLDTVQGHHNQLAFIWNGSSWNPWQVIGSGGGGGGATPVGNNGDLQMKNGLNLAASHINDSGSLLLMTEPVTLTSSLNVATTSFLGGNVTPGGPNPYFDIMAYGGYIQPSASPVTTTGSINSGSPTLTLANAQDFANGQGVVVYKAGQLPLTRNGSFPVSPTGIATPVNVTNGSTVYNYQWVLEDYFGGLTAAGATFTTTTGAAALGVQTIALTAISRVNNVDTYTCATNCNVGVGAQVNITGFAGTNSNTNGTVIVVSTPNATTFTVNANGLANYAESASATMAVVACNRLFPSGSLSPESVILRSWIYRGGTLIGVAPGQDPYYEDCGQGVSGQPVYVPTSVPGAAQAGYLATTISGGGGTTVLTLAANAGTTVAGQTVNHDNSSASLAALAAAYAADGGVVRFPVIPNNSFSTIPFYATTDFTSVSNPTNATVKFDVAQVGLSQPWILARGAWLNGIPQTTTSFAYSPLGIIGGGATPLLMANHNTSGGIRLSDLYLHAFSTGSSALFFDQKVGSGGEVGLQADNVSYVGVNAPGILIKGGFDFWLTHGTCTISGSEAAKWYSHPCIEFPSASAYVGANGQIAGRVLIDHMNFTGGTSVQFDDFPSPGSASSGGNIVMRSTLTESDTGPALRIAAANFGFGLYLDDVVLSDTINSAHQPLLEMGTSALYDNITVINSKGAGGNPTILGGGSFAAPTCINNVFLVGCGATPYFNIAGSNSTVDGGTLGAQDGGSLGYYMATPSSAPGQSVGAGGAVSVGAHSYSVAATDRSGIGFTPLAGMTLLSPSVTATATASGCAGPCQTVTITRPTLPAGAIGWVVFRDGSEANISVASGSCFTAIPASTTTFVDTFSFTCGPSVPGFNTAFTNKIISDRIGGVLADFQGYRTTPTTVKTAGYTPTVNDNIIPVDATAGGFTISLNPAIIGSHWLLLRRDTTGNVVLVAPTSGLINNAANVSLAANSGMWVTCDDGTNCRVESTSASGGGVSGTINNAPQYSMSYYSAPGSANSLSGIAPPVINETWVNGYQVVGGVPVPPTSFLLGSPYDSETGNYTLGTNKNRAGIVAFVSPATTPTLTLPAISGVLASNYSFRTNNDASGNLTVTSTAPNSINGGSAGGSVTQLPGWLGLWNQDNSPNWFVKFVPGFSAWPSCPDTNGNHINFSSANGILCGTSTPAVFYQLVGNNGTSQTARGRLNFIPGTNITYTIADNPGSNSTDVTVNAAASAGNPCVTTALSLQYDNAGSFGCLAEWTYTGAVLTGSATAKFDMSAATNTSAFKIPAFAGSTVGAAGFNYDTTNKNIHGFSNGADAIVVEIPAAPTTGDVADYSVAAGVVQAHDSGIATTNVVTAASPATAAGQLAYSASNNKTLSYASLAPSSLTDGATVTWAIGSVPAANSTLTFTVHGGSRTLNITGPLTGGTYVLRLVQDGTGGENLTLGTGCTWKVISGGAGAITLSNTANAIDILTWYYDGANCYANLGKNYN